MNTLKPAMILGLAFALSGTAFANEPGTGSTSVDEAQATKPEAKPKPKAKKVKKAKKAVESKQAVEAKGAVEAKEPTEAKKAVEAKQSWTCPMHRDIHMDHAGRCPKCGMDLVKE